MSFLECKEGTTGRALAKQIAQQLSEWGLYLTKMRGQGYDGAANMAGAVNRCAAIICRTYPKALYLHCSAQVLNLCVVAASKSILVTSMRALLKEISLFFSSSPKRQDKLIEVVKSHESNEVKSRSWWICAEYAGWLATQHW